MIIYFALNVVLIKRMILELIFLHKYLQRQISTMKFDISIHSNSALFLLYIFLQNVEVFWTKGDFCEEWEKGENIGFSHAFLIA